MAQSQTAEYLVAGYQVAGYQVAGYQMMGYQVAGHQVASRGSWGTGLGSDADIHSRYHSPGCPNPETFSLGVVPQPFQSISATPTHP